MVGVHYNDPTDNGNDNDNQDEDDNELRDPLA